MDKKNKCCDIGIGSIMIVPIDAFEKARFDIINELGERKSFLYFDIIEEEKRKAKPFNHEVNFYMK